MSTPQFGHCDTKKPDGFYVQFACEVLDDAPERDETTGRMRKQKGVRALARCMIVANGVGTFINLNSAGLWGIQGLTKSYQAEIYREEIAELKATIAAMRAPIYEEA